MSILQRIDEAVNKPSFLEFFFNRKNFRKINKVWEKYYEDLAREEGQSIIEDPQFGYTDDEGELDYEVDPVEAYDSFAHNTGYIAEYGAAEEVIREFKRNYDYQRRDEFDEEKQELIIYLNGYVTSFSGNSNMERKVKELKKQYS